MIQMRNIFSKDEHIQDTEIQLTNNKSNINTELNTCEDFVVVYRLYQELLVYFVLKQGQKQQELVHVEHVLSGVVISWLFCCYQSQFQTMPGRDCLYRSHVDHKPKQHI